MEFLVGLIFQGQRGIKGLCTKALETDIYNLSFYIFCILRLSVNLVAEFLFGHCPGFTWQGFGIWGCRGGQGERRPGSGWHSQTQLAPEQAHPGPKLSSPVKLGHL